jgi:hypothetical protein
MLDGQQKERLKKHIEQLGREIETRRVNPQLRNELMVFQSMRSFINELATAENLEAMKKILISKLEKKNNNVGWQCFYLQQYALFLENFLQYADDVMELASDTIGKEHSAWPQVDILNIISKKISQTGYDSYVMQLLCFFGESEFKDFVIKELEKNGGNITPIDGYLKLANKKEKAKTLIIECFFDTRVQIGGFSERNKGYIGRLLVDVLANIPSLQEKINYLDNKLSGMRDTETKKFFLNVYLYSLTKDKNGQDIKIKNVQDIGDALAFALRIGETLKFDEGNLHRIKAIFKIILNIATDPEEKEKIIDRMLSINTNEAAHVKLIDAYVEDAIENKQYQNALDFILILQGNIYRKASLHIEKLFEKIFSEISNVEERKGVLHEMLGKFKGPYKNEFLEYDRNLHLRRAIISAYVDNSINMKDQVISGEDLKELLSLDDVGWNIEKLFRHILSMMNINDVKARLSEALEEHSKKSYYFLKGYENFSRIYKEYFKDMGGAWNGIDFKDIMRKVLTSDNQYDYKSKLIGFLFEKVLSTKGSIEEIYGELVEISYMNTDHDIIEECVRAFRWHRCVRNEAIAIEPFINFIRGVSDNWQKQLHTACDRNFLGGKEIESIYLDLSKKETGSVCTSLSKRILFSTLPAITADRHRYVDLDLRGVESNDIKEVVSVFNDTRVSRSDLLAVRLTLTHFGRIKELLEGLSPKISVINIEGGSCTTEYVEDFSYLPSSVKQLVLSNYSEGHLTSLMDRLSKRTSEKLPMSGGLKSIKLIGGGLNAESIKLVIKNLLDPTQFSTSSGSLRSFRSAINTIIFTDISTDISEIIEVKWWGDLIEKLKVSKVTGIYIEGPIQLPEEVKAVLTQNAKEVICEFLDQKKEATTLRIDDLPVNISVHAKTWGEILQQTQVTKITGGALPQEVEVVLKRREELERERLKRERLEREGLERGNRELWACVDEAVKNPSETPVTSKDVMDKVGASALLSLPRRRGETDSPAAPAVGDKRNAGDAFPQEAFEQGGPSPKRRKVVPPTPDALADPIHTLGSAASPFCASFDAAAVAAAPAAAAPTPTPTPTYLASTAHPDLGYRTHVDNMELENKENEQGKETDRRSGHKR